MGDEGGLVSEPARRLLVWSLRTVLVDRSILAKFGSVTVSKLTGEIPLTSVVRRAGLMVPVLASWHPRPARHGRFQKMREST